MDLVKEAAVEYQRTGTLNSGNRVVLLTIVRDGVKYHSFESLLSKYPFSIEDWSKYLHLSERTLQRYKKESKTFDSLQSEKILQIMMLYQRGVEVFGDSTNFDLWLSVPCVALGAIAPKDLLDTAFGIALIEEVLTRIEHGILA